MAYTARTAPLPRGYGFSPFLMDSVSSASVISAAAGRTITFLAANQLPQGYYAVSVLATLGNVVGATADLGNMVLQNGVTTITALAVNSNTIVPLTYYLSMSGTDSLAIVANYTATAGVQYMASLVATALHLGA